MKIGGSLPKAQGPWLYKKVWGNLFKRLLFIFVYEKDKNSRNVA